VETLPLRLSSAFVVAFECIQLVGATEAFYESITSASARRVSTTLRQVLTEFSEFFHVSGTGLLIHTSLGRAGGLGALRTKRSG
jgi:hypothetical protein